MRLVTMTRDMRPYGAGHDVALPDDLAAKLIADGGATPAAAEKAANLRPDGPAAAPAPAPAAPGRNRYLTREQKR